MEIVEIKLNKREAKFAKHYAKEHNMNVSEAMKDAFFEELKKHYLENENSAYDLLKEIGVLRKN